MAIQKGKSTVSLSGGEFLTYTHLTPTRCVFLVYVPQLRKFSTDAKETMAEIAWVSAQQDTSGISPPPQNITVGIRGALIYDRALTGAFLKDPNENRDGLAKEVTGAAASNLLASQFAPEPPPPATPSTTTDQAGAEDLGEEPQTLDESGN